ncbi:hypothetical protein [Limnofasciculus baicalensis]|uniref:Secreted protein n=1 Tax=Limnofasciculus baicalensis BBK-W-15 TaxID=2699891 RepID=A0AAE3GTZ2_9CYAN|nr:hypothetical protein [Limnofasciculus baicalensis]MCP2730670.1 hypothetical protein [Limnofasciculus baicalensis BBK-W-15]
MKIPQIFQKLIALVAVVALAFGFAAPSASAATIFNAPYGASIFVQYYSQLEIGTTVYDQPTNTVTLLCNNRFGSGAGSEWKGTCLQSQQLGPSENFLIQGYSKPSGPGGTCWTKADMSAIEVPSPNPGNNRYLTTLYSKFGTTLAQLILDGRGLVFQGEGETAKPPFRVCP